MTLQTSMDVRNYIALYTAVYNFCTAQKTVRTAHLRGEDIYLALRKYLKQYLSQLRDSSSKSTNEALLTFFVDEWERYRFASTYIKGIFRKLDQMWIQRQRDEGKKGVLYVSDMLLVQWKEIMFDFLHQSAMEAVLELVRRQRTGQLVGYSDIRKFINMFSRSHCQFRSTRSNSSQSR